MDYEPIPEAGERVAHEIIGPAIDCTRLRFVRRNKFRRRGGSKQMTLRLYTHVCGMLIVAAIATLIQHRACSSETGSPTKTVREDPPDGLPEFDSENALLVPKDYREWVFVGSSLGLGYKQTDQPTKGNFSHVYINPFGYRAFRETGRFPVGTVLVLEAASRGEKTNPALNGSFSKDFIGLEAAVKTGDRFKDPWTYYNFYSKDRQRLSKAMRLTTDSCISCHRKHGETDHVFTQFYPVLRAVKPAGE